VQLLAERLGVTTRFLRSSQMAPLAGQKLEPLLELCARLGATSYLSPAGASGYLDDERPWRERGITLEFQRFEHPSWPQVGGGEFQSHLSAIDLMFNAGDGALGLLRGGRRPSGHVGDGV